MNKDLYGTNLSINSPNLRGLVDSIILKYGDKAEFMKHIKANGFKISYSYAKKVKNYFDNNKDDQALDFILYGGHDMKNYINKMLANSRNGIYRSKKIKHNMGMQNQFIKPHEKSYLKPSGMDTLKPGTGRQKIELTEWAIKEQGVISDTNSTVLEPIPQEEPNVPKLASACVVLNKNKEILLVKRSSVTTWEPNKFAFVGGKVDENETPDEAVIREVFEETSILLKTMKFAFSKHDGSFDVFFYVGISDNNDVKLSNEHTEYVWAKPEDLSSYDLVPSLIDDLQKALTICYTFELNKKNSI